MIKLVNILNEIRVNPPIRTKVVEKIMNYINNNNDFDYYEYMEIKEKIYEKTGIITIHYYNINKRTNNYSYDFSTISNNKIIQIYNIIKPYFEEKNINIKEL